MLFLRYLLTSSIRGPETKFRYLSPKEHECTLVFKYTYWLADIHELFSVLSSDISVSDPVNTKEITFGELSRQVGIGSSPAIRRFPSFLILPET
jgi:hypothetical protein